MPSLFKASRLRRSFPTFSSSRLFSVTACQRTFHAEESFALKMNSHLLVSSASAPRCYNLPCRRHFADGVSQPASSTPLNLAFVTQTSSGAFAPAAQHVQGKVLWFNSRKGYGFVTRSDTGENIFVNAVDIATRNPKQPSASLDDGEPIEFDVVMEPSGKPRAMRVTGPGGVPVRGKASPFAVAASDQQRLQLESRGTIVERNVKGVVKWYNLVKRYGFITRSDTSKEIYVTSRGILRANRAHALRSLGAGEAVQFHALEKAPGLYEAVGVTGPNHAPVRGSPDAEGPLALRIFQGDFDYLRVQRLKRQEEAQREGLPTESEDFRSQRF